MTVYHELTETVPPQAGPYLVRGIWTTNGEDWYRVLDWNFKPRYKKVISGFSAGGMTLNAYLKFTHWAKIPLVEGATRWQTKF